jgi:hypothetical protein
MKVQWYEGRHEERTNTLLPDIGGSTPTMITTSEIPVDLDGTPRSRGEDSPTPDVEIFRAPAFDNLTASIENIEILTLWIGECSGLPGATM